MELIDCSIVVSTFGDEKWKVQATERALPSAKSFGLPVYYNHEKTLCEARNAGLYQVQTEFVCHLDADDELAPDFFEHMRKVDGDLRPPSVHHVLQNIAFMPNVVGHTHTCIASCLQYGNWLVVGTVARTSILKEVGGWKDWATFEDFDLWQRAWLAGATITPVPNAMYRAYTTTNGRCRGMPVVESTKVQRMICETNMPDKDFSWLQ
jgi:glycosyltransferase involved in cell wall biosynthesis